MNTTDIKWYFTEEDGKEVEVPLEEWVWHVVYEDGTELHQYEREADENGKRRFHQFKEIDQTKVKVFEMMNTKDTGLRYSIDITEHVGQIFHFYRRSRLNIGRPDETKVVFYCYGAVIDGVSVYNFILPDNRIVTTTNRDITLL